MKTLALMLLMASPHHAISQAFSGAASSGTAASTGQAAAVPSGTLESSKLKLAAQDAAGALADAETAVADGGGAAAYAARAAAKRALGGPLDEVISDYAKAAKLDPNYAEKYNGLIVQLNSEATPDSKAKRSGIKIENGANVIANAIGIMLAVGLLLISALVIFRGRDRSASPEESKVAGGSQPATKEPSRDS